MYACNCCDQQRDESFDHVFSTGLVATIWKQVAWFLGIYNVEIEPWCVKINRWFNHAKQSSLISLLLGLLLIIITWRLWTQRSKARMEEKYDPIESIWLAIRYWTTQIVDGFFGHVHPKLIEMLSDLQFQSKRPRANNAHHLIVWNRPTIGWIKLNVEGSCQDNSGSFGGGGVFSDHRGNFLATFSEKLDAGTNHEAKLQALNSGVKLCNRLSFWHITI